MSKNQSVTIAQRQSFPTVKLKNIVCTLCKHQFFIRAGINNLNGMNLPLLLSCGHPICNRCVKIRKPNCCSICEDSPTSLQDGTFPPVNIYAVGMINVCEARPAYGAEPDISFSQGLATRPKQKSVQRDHCYECGMQATLRCKECKTLYCHACSNKIHGKFKSLSNHHIVLLPNADKTAVFGAKICEEHNEIMDYYCGDCRFSSCHHCMLHSHIRHDVIPLATKNAQFINRFEMARNKVGEILHRVRNTQKKIKKGLAYPNQLQSSENIEATINRHFIYLHGVLQNTEKLLIERLQKQRNNITRNLHDIQECLKIEEDQLHSVLMMARNVKDIINQINLEDIIPKLEELAAVPCHLVQDAVLDTESIVFEPDSSIKSIIESHCRLDIPEIPGYNLLPEDRLPAGYEPEPLNLEKSKSYMDISMVSKTSMMKRASSYQSLFTRRFENKTLREGSVVLVKMCHIEHPSNFYVRPVAHEEKVAELEKILDTHPGQSDSIPKEVLQNNLYAVKNETSGKWYRGRVNTINTDLDSSDTYELLDIDNGSIEHKVPKERMRYISLSLTTTPPTVIKCSLYDIVPKDGKWTTEACATMAKYQKPNQVLTMHIIKVQGNTYYVDLRTENSRTKASLRDYLIYSDFGSLNNAHQLLRSTPMAVQRYYLEEMSLNAYYDVIPTYVESPDLIYVKKKGEDSHYCDEMITRMCEYYNDIAKSEDGIIHVPELGISCAVQYEDDTWYRGSIKEVLKSRMVLVTLVDSGMSVPVNYDKIRKLHEKFCTWPAQAIRVSLADVKPADDRWSEEAKVLLSQQLKEQVVRAFVFEKYANLYVVSLFAPFEVNVAALLVAKGFAVSTGPRSSGATELPHPTSHTNNGNGKVRNMLTVKMKKMKRTANSQRSSSKVPDDPFKLPVKVIRVVSPDTIYLADPSNAEAHQQMTNKMQSFYGKFEQRVNPEEWKVDTHCAVYSERDRMFCRGKIIALKNPEEAEVFLYDLSFTEIIPVAKLQGLIKRFLKRRMNVFKVKLAGIYPSGGSSEWTSAASGTLKDLIAECQNNCGKCWISKMGNIEKESFDVELWIQQTKIDGPLAPKKIEINSVNRILVELGLALPIKQCREREKKVLAAELKRQISVTHNKGDPEEEIETVNGTFERKKQSADAESIKDVNSEEESVSSDKSDMDDEESANETTQSSEILTGENFISPNGRVIASAEEQIVEWLPAAPIVDDTFVAIATSLDHECCLYLHSIHQSGNVLHHMEQILANEYDNMEVEPYDFIWKEGEPCIAQYHANNKWYRAQVRRVLDDNMIEVEFIDYGNVEECENGTLRKRLKLTDIPRQGGKCVIHGLHPNTENRKWRTCDLDRIHALLIDRECEISVVKRQQDHLVVSVTVTNPKRRSLLNYLRYDLHLNVLIDQTIFESLSEESDESTLDNDDDVIIETYINHGKTEENLDDKSNNNEKENEVDMEKRSEDAEDKYENEENEVEDLENKYENEENKFENDENVYFNGNCIKNCAIDKNHFDEENEKNDINNEFEFPVSIQMPKSMTNGYPEQTTLSDVEYVDTVEKSENLELISDVILTGTANFTCSADRIEINQRDDQLDRISLTEIICLKDEDVITSTPHNCSFDVGVQWKKVKIPEDVEVVKAEVARISLEDLFVHVLDNNNSKILTIQREMYEKTMKEMQVHANHQPILKIIKKDAPCCTKFIDGKWYRCTVVDYESSPYELGHTIKVHFVDFGNDAHVKSYDVRSIKEEWLDAPRMSMRCIPFGVILAPTANCEEACKKILDVYQNHDDDKNPREVYIKIRSRSASNYEVEIYKDEGCTELVYQSIINEGLYIDLEKL